MSRQEKRYLSDRQREHLTGLDTSNYHPKDRAYIRKILRLGWYFTRDSKSLNQFK